MYAIKVGQLVSTITGAANQESYDTLRNAFTVRAPGSEYLHAVQLRKVVRDMIRHGVSTGQGIRDAVFHATTDQALRGRLNQLSYYVEEHKLDRGEAINLLAEFDAENGDDGLVCLINECHEFDTGLLQTVVEQLQRQGQQVKITNYLGSPELQSVPSAKLPNEKVVQLWDYQQEVLNVVFGRTLFGSIPFPRGVIKVATGGGKTEIAVAIYQCNHLPSVFFVHRKDLLEQAAKRFEKYHIPVGRIGDGLFQPNYETVTIATMQTLWRVLAEESERRDELQRLLTQTQQLFFDEAHLLAANKEGANTFVRVARSFENAAIRWGLTATPFVKGNEFSDWLLEGATGPLLCSITNAELIKKGYLAKPIVKMVDISHREVYEDPIMGFELQQPKGRGLKWAELYKFAVVANPIRNKAIVQWLQKVPKPCLALVKQQKHIDYLFKAGLPKDTVILTGKSSTKERLAAVRDLRNGKIDVIVTTPIFDEGVDIPELQSVILAGGGKSQIKALQQLGRGLRTAEGKSEVWIIDFIDSNVSSPGWLPAKHSKARRQYYIQEEFEVEVVRA